MKVKLFNMVLHSGLLYSEISNDFKSLFTEIVLDNSNIILRSTETIMYRNVKFRFTLSFVEGILKRISLVAADEQECMDYKDIFFTHELHKKWLIDNYGNPTRIEVYGYIYEYENGTIGSEYDPRSGSADNEKYTICILRYFVVY